MVVSSLSADPDEGRTDEVFRALADATRRDILRRCARAEHSVSALAGEYPMSFAAVQKHVAALAAAGLVTKRRHGREQLVTTRIDAVRLARCALDQLDELWRSRIERMDELLSLDLTTS